MTVTLSLAEVDALTMRALTACNTREVNAGIVTDSVVASEADGIHSHGLARLPTYCEHARCGKIDGQATPRCERSGPAALVVDVCEISPPHDPSGMTALNAAHLLFDMLCHAAEALVRRRAGG